MMKKLLIATIFACAAFAQAPVPQAVGGALQQSTLDTINYLVAHSGGGSLPTGCTSPGTGAITCTGTVLAGAFGTGTSITILSTPALCAAVTTPAVNTIALFRDSNASNVLSMKISAGTCSAVGSGTSTPGTSGQVLTSDGAGAFGTSLTVGTSASNLVQLNGSAKLPSVDGSLLTGLTSNLTVFYPESYGALRNNSHDDTTAIQSALTAAGAAGGIVQLAAGSYRVTAALTVPSLVIVKGQGRRTSWIVSSSTLLDVFQITGTGAGNCQTGLNFGAQLQDFGIQRTAQATAGVGVNVYKACFAGATNVESWDSLIGFRVELSGNTKFQDTEVYWQFGGSVARRGYLFDSTSGIGNATSVMAVHNIVAAGGTNITGLEVSGACPSDFFSYGLETSAVDNGVLISSTASTSPTPTNSCNGDIHLVQTILDQIQVKGIIITGIQGGGVPNVELSGGYLSGDISAADGLDIESSQGVVAYGLHFQFLPVGALINGATSQNNNISNSKFDVCGIGLQITRGTRNIASGNAFTSVTGLGSTAFVDINTNAVLNLVFNNQFNGFATTAISIDNSSIGNTAWPNLIDPTNITNSITPGTGKGNIVNGEGYSLPVASVCGAVDAASTNVAGTVTSATTGACGMVLTFDVSRMGQSSNGWNCSVSNQTHPGSTNFVSQVSSTATSATFSGTTISGDVLSYICRGF